jgi:hypothetical protein
MAEIVSASQNGSQVKVVYSYTQNVAKNTTTLTLTLYVHRDSYGPSWNTHCNSYIQVDGANVMTYTGSFNIGSSWVKIGSTVSKTVTHSADGAKSVTIKGFFDSQGLTSKLDNLSVSKSIALPTIPRASSFSLSTASVTAGATSMTVNITRASSSFTHEVVWKFGSHTYTASNIGTSSAYTVPASWLDAIPNSKSGTGSVTVTTYSGGAKIGSGASKSFTVTAPASAKPTVSSLAVTRVDNGVPAAWGVYVKGKSKAVVKISGVGQSYGSPIKSYSLSGGGYSAAAATLNTGVLNKAGTVTFTGTVTDGRGSVSDAKTASITVLDYSGPVISSASAIRCNSAGTAQDDGSYIKLTASYSGSTVGGKNTISGKYQYRQGSGSWSALTAFSSGSAVIIPNCSPESTYTVKVQVSDAFTSITRELTVNAATFILDFKKGGKGVGIGKVAESDNLLDVGWNAKFRGSLTDAQGRNVDAWRNPVWVANGTNFDTLTTPGLYYQPTIANTTNNTNMPEKIAFFLEVFQEHGNNTVFQVFHRYNGQALYQRGSGADGKNWTGWSQIYTSAQRNVANGVVGMDGGKNISVAQIVSSTNLVIKSGYPVVHFYYNGAGSTTSGIQGFGPKASSSEIDPSGVSLWVKNGNGTIGHVQLIAEQGGDNRFIFRPWGNGLAYLGSTTYRWNTGFFTNTITQSDLKMKENIGEIPHARDFIMALRPISYTLVNGEGGRTHLGFGAQDVARAAKETNMGDLSLYQAARVDENGNELPYSPEADEQELSWGLNYSELIAPLVALVQKQEARIQALEEQVRNRTETEES